MGGRGRPRKNTSKFTDVSVKEQGTQSVKFKEKVNEEDDLDLESDSELNWPDLSKAQLKLATPEKTVTRVTPMMSSGTKNTHAEKIGAEEASKSKNPSNGTVTPKATM